MHHTFTVFCRDSNNLGTTWIDTVHTREDDADEAASLGRAKCAQDWNRTDDPSSIIVIGVARGDVDIVYWEDIE